MRSKRRFLKKQIIWNTRPAFSNMTNERGKKRFLVKFVGKHVSIILMHVLTSNNPFYFTILVPSVFKRLRFILVNNS